MAGLGDTTILPIRRHVCRVILFLWIAPPSRPARVYSPWIAPAVAARPSLLALDCSGRRGPDNQALREQEDDNHRQNSHDTDQCQVRAQQQHLPMG